jgi:putative nucleotidyltransferase with HDIG domain
MFRSLKRAPARLVTWNGRARRVAWLERLRRHPLTPRLAVVFGTVVLVTAMVYSSGPPLAVRVGEIPARDLRVRIAFAVVNTPQTEWAREEAGRNGLGPIVEQYPVGMPLAKAGQPITDGQHTLLKQEHRVYRDAQPFSKRLVRWLCLFLVVLLLATVITLYVSRFQAALASDVAHVTGMCALVLATVGISVILSKPPWYALLIPMSVTAMVLTIAYNPPFALLMSFSLALVSSLALGTGLDQLLIQLAGLATAILLLRNVQSRTRLVRIALEAAAACSLMTFANGMLNGQSWQFIGSDVGRNFLWFTLGGFILCGALPIVEYCFGVVTDVSLIELANSSHPLLQDLVRHAPGTYTHSMTVATLAESAAEAIGANVLLARVGSYFHDVGKMLKPQYFVENQDRINRHDELEPALSTLVIIGHVKDGIALAQQYRLPKPVADLIQQHHGTTLVEYFYREALRIHDGEPSPALEASFRYPGPKPQSREAGILMLADAVESASRALTAPTPNSLRKLVHDLTTRRLLDCQFEESGLTLTEVYRIEESLCKGLIALFHARIKYPDPTVRKAG